MTSEQKEIITQMRSEGQGFGRIAQVLGLSRDTIKSFCRRHDVVAKIAPEKKGCCPQCGRPVECKEHTKPRRFCSSLCRQAWWNTHPECVGRKAVYQFICATCGSTFSAYGNSHRKYCSHDCYIKARFKVGASHDA